MKFVFVALQYYILHKLKERESYYKKMVLRLQEWWLIEKHLETLQYMCILYLGLYF